MLSLIRKIDNFIINNNNKELSTQMNDLWEIYKTRISWPYKPLKIIATSPSFAHIELLLTSSLSAKIEIEIDWN